MVSPYNSRLVYEIFLFLKQTRIVTSFLSLLVTELFLWNRKERVLQLGMWFRASLGFSEYRTLSLAKDVLRYNELPIATGMMSISKLNPQDIIV